MAAPKSPSFLPVIRTITDATGHEIEPADEMRLLAPFTAEVVTGDGPDRIELGVSGGLVVGLTAGPGISITGPTTSPTISGVPSSTSAPGTMSAADKTKLNSMTAGAAVATVGVSGALTFGGTATNPIVGIPVASPFVPGSQSTAHYSLLAGATDAATANALVKRDASGDIDANIVTAEALHVGGESSSFAGDIGLTPCVETYAASIQVIGRLGGRHDVTLTGNVHFDAPTAHAEGSTIKVRVVQGAGAPYMATWANVFRFGPGTSGTLDAIIAGDEDFFIFEHCRTPTLSLWTCVAHVKISPP